MPPDRALHLLERIGALLRAEVRRTAAADGLEPVHILALWYLSRANRFSDNPLAVGGFLGLSKGNMSQRLNVLESRGLLRKKADAGDGRRLHLALTSRGRAILAKHYPPSLWTAPPGRALELELDALLRAMVAANGGKTFGICRTCRFHQPRRGGSAHCGLLNLSLTLRQANQICQEHEPPPVP